ncbi:MAG: hypothetical protein PHX47_02345, partial [Candidatus ainarchaeum sp.]|nr:hypothetical protein [Candidatus ainarchaeum sp.]
YVIGETTALLIEDVDLDSDNYSLLTEEDVDADNDASNGAGSALDDELTIEDTFTITNPLIKFDNDEDVGDLTLTIEKETMTYTVDLDEGIEVDYDDDEVSPSLNIPFMGKNYLIDEWDGTTLTLLESKSTQAYAEGESFEVDGHTVEVANILDTGDNSGYDVELTLKDAEGNVVATEVYDSNDDEIFEDYLDSVVQMDKVYSSRVTFLVGTSGKLELENGDLEDFPEVGDEFWKVTLDTDGSDSLFGFTLKNTSDLEFVDEDALRVGDSISLPNDFLKVEFLGLTSESTEDFVVGDNVIEYVDASDDDHSIFIYEQDDTTSTFADWTTDGEIDGDKIYFSFATDGDDYDVNVHYNDEDGDLIGTANQEMNEGWNELVIPAEDGDGSWTYGVYLSDGDTNLNESAISLPKEIAIGLKTGDLDYSVYGSDSKEWMILNNDTDGDNEYMLLNGESADSDLKDVLYVGQLVATGSVTGTDDVVTEELEAAFTLALFDGVDTIEAIFDAYEGDLIDTESDDWESGNFQVTEPFDLGIHDSDDLTWAYSKYGTKFMINSGEFTAIIPEKQLYGQIFVGGGSSSEVTLNGGELVLTTPGTVVETEDGMISAKLITSTVTGGEEMTAMTPANWNASTQRIVYLDNETMTSAGAKIIVGGHLVNALANGITDEYLTEAGQYVVGAVENGNIVVAGFSAADTAEAAKELINAIEALE